MIDPADAIEALGLPLATLADATVARLRAVLPAAASVHNPVDMLASAGPREYGECLAEQAPRRIDDHQADQHHGEQHVATAEAQLGERVGAGQRHRELGGEDAERNIERAKADKLSQIK